MKKKLTWHATPERVSKSQKSPSLVWLVPGCLAQVTTVERTGRGWRSKKKLRLHDIVTVIEVHGQDSNGWCTVLRMGTIHTISNSNLRPLAD